MKDNQPLLLVFYGMMRDIEIDTIKKQVEAKVPNAVMFFLPAKEYRLECINPVLISEQEYVEIREKLEDIREVWNEMQTKGL